MGTIRILICDNEPEMRAHIACVLDGYMISSPIGTEKKRFTTRAVASAEEALELVQECKPQIIFLEDKLPGMSGMELLEKLDLSDDSLLAIMITAGATIEAAVRATRTGAYDFLPKPFSPEDLINTATKAARHIILSEQARACAEEKRKARFNFIQILGHELKAPLNAVEGYLDIIRKKTAGTRESSQKTYDEMLDRSMIRIQGMRKLITDLLDMTMIESGQHRRELVPVDICKAAKNAIDLIQKNADERGIKISLNCAACPTIEGDATEIEVILNNLLSNAVKYNTDSGTVAVTVDQKENCTTIMVADTGIGMTTEETLKLFKDFSRIKNPQTRDISGSGLGLSTVRKICQLYGGDISVESTPEKGSTFTVKLYQKPPCRTC
ncbi:MAG: hybrid sensor histidine kinase/response regulator [Planctomycetes bacterium]|nr:hybrid sensor histidine kinase/response regulator [Planctomycetota bacterium]